ncbi:hypothetical protein C8R44DRAFT_868432 [Mycena epipterygia]|nr:hypothetical protein C8R44DRAFT_868432 [Mycena epipterygia]
MAMRAGEDLRGQPSWLRTRVERRLAVVHSDWTVGAMVTANNIDDETRVSRSYSSGNYLFSAPRRHVWGARAVLDHQHRLTFLPTYPSSSPLAASSEFSVRFEPGPPPDIRPRCRPRLHPACASPLLETRLDADNYNNSVCNVATLFHLAHKRPLSPWLGFVRFRHEGGPRTQPGSSLAAHPDHSLILDTDTLHLRSVSRIAAVGTRT